LRRSESTGQDAAQAEGVQKGQMTPTHIGRAKGTPNRSTQRVVDLCERMGCDPFEVLAKITMNTLECGVCGGTGKTRFQPKSKAQAAAALALGVDLPEDLGPDGSERKCQSCWESGMERIDPETRLSAAKELSQYLAPKRKALEIQDDQGHGLPHGGWRMVIVDDRKPIGGRESIPPQINSRKEE
jgi:hypothetical protein